MSNKIQKIKEEIEKRINEYKEYSQINYLTESTRIANNARLLELCELKNFLDTLEVKSEYDENGWKDLGNGLKVNKLGHVELTEEERKRLEDSMYDENGWKDLGNGLKMDRQGHIAGGLKLK